MRWDKDQSNKRDVYYTAAVSEAKLPACKIKTIQDKTYSKTLSHDAYFHMRFPT